MKRQTEIVPAAIVEMAVNLEQTKAEIIALKAKLAEGDAIEATVKQTLHAWRCRMGVLLTQARKAIPASGPRARAWSELLDGCGLTKDSALNYMKLAEFADRYPVEAATMNAREIYRKIGKEDSPNAIRESQAPALLEAPKSADPKKPRADKPPAAPAAPVEAPKSAAKPAVKVTYDRGGGGAGEEYQEAPGDGLPEVKIEPPTGTNALMDDSPDAALYTAPAALRQDVPLSERPALFAGRDEEPPFDLAKARDAARAVFLGLFVEWPKKHWAVLRECFDEASTESES